MIRLLKRPSLVVCAALCACGPRPGAERPSDLQLASLGEPATAALVVGCWALGWSFTMNGPLVSVVALPDSVRLREEVVFGSRERILAPATHPTGRTAIAGEDAPWEARFVVNRWWMENDVLRLRFDDGEQGEQWTVALGVQRGDLVGVGRYTWQRGTPVEAGVRATRIECGF